LSSDIWRDRGSRGESRLNLISNADLSYPRWPYRREMLTWIRVTRVAILLVLAVVAVSLLVAMFRPEVGGYERVALAALVAACFGLGIAVTAAAKHLGQRFAVPRESARQR
jgi:hypothetical protein